MGIELLMAMRSFFIIKLIILLFPFTSLSQEINRGIEYVFDFEKIKQCNQIVWYGWDFSNLLLSDFKSSELNLNLKRNLIPSILNLFEERGRNVQYMSDIFKKTLQFNQESVQSLYLKKDDLFFCDGNRLPIDVKNIPQIIQSYSLKDSGIGAVIIVDEFNKVGRFTTTYFTFFEIESRKLLYICKVKARAGDKFGMARYYGNGLMTSPGTFYDYYKKQFQH